MLTWRRQDFDLQSGLGFLEPSVGALMMPRSDEDLADLLPQVIEPAD